MKKKIVLATIIMCCAAVVIVGGKNISKSRACKSIEEEKTSMELLEATLNNDHILDVYYYSEPEECIETIKNKCEAFNVLEDSEDYIDTVIRKYYDYKLLDYYETDIKVIDSLTYVYGTNIDTKLNEILYEDNINKSVENDIKELSKVYFLECLVTSKDFIESCSKEQLEDVKKAAYVKYVEKEDSLIHCDLKDSVYELAKISDTVKELGVEINSRGDVATVLTPNGSKVEVEILEYNGDRWSNMMTMRTKKDFPDVKILAKADNRYNCHSYAWYQQSPSNPYWMNNPLKFVSDGSFKEKSEPSENDKVIWAVKSGRPYIEHSGIVVGKDEKDVIVVSKWGQGPLVEHYESYSPYKNKTYYYNR